MSTNIANAARGCKVGRRKPLFAGELDFEGNRAIVLQAADPVPAKPLASCIAMALTYHRFKR